MPKEFKNFNIKSLIYKATTDGFGSRDFHRKVKGINNILIIITSENGNRFGGFTPLAFTGNGGHMEDDSLMTFIFSLDKRTKFKLKCREIQDEEDYAIFDNIDYHVVFGGIYETRYVDSFTGDIQLSSYCNKNVESHSKLLNCFENKSLNLKYNTENSKSYLAGSYNFKVKEIEIYQICKHLVYLI